MKEFKLRNVNHNDLLLRNKPCLVLCAGTILKSALKKAWLYIPLLQLLSVIGGKFSKYLLPESLPSLGIFQCIFLANCSAHPCWKDTVFIKGIGSNSAIASSTMAWMVGLSVFQAIVNFCQGSPMPHRSRDWMIAARVQEGLLVLHIYSCPLSSSKFTGGHLYLSLSARANACPWPSVATRKIYLYLCKASQWHLTAGMATQHNLRGGTQNIVQCFRLRWCSLK